MLTLMVKAALMEKLWVVCDKMNATRQDWYKAEHMVGIVYKNNEDCDAFRAHVNELNELTPAFVEFLIKKLRKKGSKTLWMIDCLDSILAQKSTTTDSFISIDHYNQAVTQVSIGNIISSLRTLSGFDSTVLFENLSEVERILKQDPCGIYPKMDFNSRNQYRNTIKKLAGRNKTTEINIARLCYNFSKEAYEVNNNLSPINHVGYYLVGKGQKTLLESLNKKLKASTPKPAFIKKNSVDIYISSIILLALIIPLISLIYSLGKVPNTYKVFAILVGILSIIPASEIVIAIINSCISRFVPPARFPKLELKEGIPQELSTMVIVPTLIPNIKRTLALIDNLEVFYLANKCQNIYFSLVGDFKDANEEVLSEDSTIVQSALKRIEELNKKYPSNVSPIFYFFCRGRQFNQKQNKWMGWERKRGAIIEFNRMLRGKSDTSYIYHSAQSAVLPNIKYVITLDADTQLPLETAKQLVGTIAHPLNKAVFDEKKSIVTEGYGLLQPRIDVNIESANASSFTKIFAGQGGIDPYTTTVSDVYQDAFGEGIFTGKGIYDIDIFQKTLDNVIPENTVLSHDLLEGSYLRTGLVTDVELIDGYPAKYNSFMMRLHRWTRGDWQLLSWIFGENPLSRLSRWKMLDNLRRSLLYPVLAIILLLSLSALHSSSFAWICITLLALCSPILSYFVHLIFAGDYRMYIAKRSATVMTGFKSMIMQLGLILTFAPYQAILMTNAIVKTLIRVLVTKKNLLEWVTAADMELALKNDLFSYYRRMWFSPVFGVIVLMLCAYFRNYFWWSIATFILWFLAPWIAFRISNPENTREKVLSSDSLNELRLLARKTWCYFDEFAGSEENYLPADNYQVDPYKGAAHRTSPTNIGLLLVSNLAARDLGYINTVELLERTQNTINTIEKMEKWNGHLFNWYNTINLEVLRPRFVSTVDSGNFAGYLMVLKEGLLQYQNRPIYDEVMIDGFFDLLELCNTEINRNKPYFDIELLKALIQRSSDENKSLDNEKKVDDSESNKDIFNKLILAISKYLNEFINKNKPEYWVRKLANQVNAYHTALEKYGEKIFTSLREIQEIDIQLEKLKNRIQLMIDSMQFKSLFDVSRNLFTIGFDVDGGHASKSYYDLFASEARQTSLIAIAKGEVSKQHWFKLGRKLVRIQGNTGLVSWTGTMFEYLMPRLLVKSYPNTLIEKTYEFVVKAQINYGLNKNTPWGISESCYHAFDIALNYQYRAFGVPHLGLKRGLVNDLVIAPYATIMAIDIEPKECMNNIQRLKQLGAEGKFGLYEAVDFTASRLSEGQKCAIVKSYMVHHQGMSMLAFVNYLKDNVMQARFHKNPQIKAVDALIQEKFPTNTIISKEYREQPLYGLRKQANIEETVIRNYSEPAVIPKLHLLTNGSYNVVLTEKGSGYGRCNSFAVYRWINDYMQSSGAFIYLRNINSNDYWSVTYSPTNTKPEVYKVIFSPHKAEYIRREGNIETNTEVIVSAEDNTEIRRVSIHNHSSSSRIIELTSYMEVVLSQPEADIAHTAFSKLFVKTEYINQYDGLLAMRRKRDDVKQTVWGYHIASTSGKVQGKVEYETDRSQFIGRNRNLASPKAMEPDQPLSNSIGPVLDPIFSLRIRVSVDAGESAVVNFCIGTSDTRQTALDMLEKYSDATAAERVIEMAWTRSVVEAGFGNVSASDERAYLRLLPRLLYAIDRREQSEYILKNTFSQAELWPLGISGDLPIVLVTIQSRDSFEEILWALKLHDYYRLKGITFDLVILITDEEAYNQPILDMIRDMAISGRSCEHLDRKGGIFIRKIQQMSSEQKNLLFTCAKIIIDADNGIGDLLEDDKNTETEVDGNTLAKADAKVEANKAANHREAIKNETLDHNAAIDNEYISNITDNLKFFNGVGGFTNDGNEYVICLKAGENTPAPWVNVIANDKFGFICTESGGGYTWHQNSGQNKLTTWINDPVMDIPSEIIYLHDATSDEIWNCTPAPVREEEPYVIRHGFGYTSFLHKSHGLEQKLIQFAAVDTTVKISIVTLKNTAEKEKILDVAYYLRPVLGAEVSQTAPYIVTSFDKESSTIFVDNVYSSDFKGLKALLSCSEENITYTGQRLEFLGNNMDLSEPQGMRKTLEGTVGAGLDACAVTKAQVNILPGETKQVVFLFGQESPDISHSQILRFRDVRNAKDELNRVKENWYKKLKQIQVNTPDIAMNILLNGWLQYQVISSRIWARAGFYQAGGAFGFRDQLQDVMSVVYTLPEITRNQVLLHCRHQFVEGDVQHWWHDQKMNGIRTRYSDDLLWLPYVTCDYINATGDYDILNIHESYIQSAILSDNEHERYEIPKVAEVTGSVYEHCIKAIDKGLKFGVHGIPLMGGGDWNDGMNLIGVQGKGESVWLGWFLYCVLQKIIPICRHMKDSERADIYQTHATRIIEAIEKEAWDGSWYRRAYFDDGTPLGSIKNEEGKIDSLSQSWAAISAAAKSSRVEEAMSAMEKYLIDRKNGLIKLLTPPFYDSELNPGYIKGYLPGVRENGGQYTHAATWVVYAFSRLGNGERAWELFNMINPINHARTDMECMTYKVEPYVMAADVYAVYPNEGRGGWTWYTGAAGWMYRIGIEHILGIKKQGNQLIIEPCIPQKLSEYSVRYIYGDSIYNILIKNQGGKDTAVKQIKIDEKTFDTNKIELIDDGRTHRVEVYM
ncbi:MAG: GH36-type glycosyl hydrolase domain-containing protein [Ruminiclostridium sp.]